MEDNNKNFASNYEFVMSLNELKFATFMGVQIKKFLESQNLLLDQEGLDSIIETYYNWLQEECNMSIEDINE